MKDFAKKVFIMNNIGKQRRTVERMKSGLNVPV